MATYYTSFLFAPVSYYALYKEVWYVAFVFNILFGTSILHHAKYFDTYVGKRYIYLVDKFLAHAAVAATMYMSVAEFERVVVGHMIYVCGLLWITYVYYIAELSHLPGRQWIPWHASIHIVASIGTSALLAEVHKK
jgi:hypothetical protein